MQEWLATRVPPGVWRRSGGTQVAGLSHAGRRRQPNTYRFADKCRQARVGTWRGATCVPLGVWRRSGGTQVAGLIQAGRRRQPNTHRFADKRRQARVGTWRGATCVPLGVWRRSGGTQVAGVACNLCTPRGLAEVWGYTSCRVEPGRQAETANTHRFADKGRQAGRRRQPHTHRFADKCRQARVGTWRGATRVPLGVWRRSGGTQVAGLS